MWYQWQMPGCASDNTEKLLPLVELSFHSFTWISVPIRSSTGWKASDFTLKSHFYNNKILQSVCFHTANNQKSILLHSTASFHCTDGWMYRSLFKPTFECFLQVGQEPPQSLQVEVVHLAVVEELWGDVGLCRDTQRQLAELTSSCGKDKGWWWRKQQREKEGKKEGK